MSGFNFEKNLTHQTNAVNSTIAVFENLDIKKAKGINCRGINPEIDYSSNLYVKNLKKVKEINDISEKIKPQSNIIDIMMETGTGKTYTYTKTIFELNKNYGIFKFVVVVPTLSIKAGTVNFLKSAGCREHFFEQYAKKIRLHIVESQKTGKNKKNYFPAAVSSFVKAESSEKNIIQILLINQGMINSGNMDKQFDITLWDEYSVAFNALAATKPFMIIDEPHKFKTDNKTWKNIQKIKPQFILRYGATFPDIEIKQKKSVINKKVKKDYQNLVYTLTAVDSFNQNLVKGVIGYITDFENGKNTIVKFTGADGTEANFELTNDKIKKNIKLIKKESFEKIHVAMTDLYIEKLNKTTVFLSNGMELKKGDKINPYSYAQKLQEIMIQKAVENHFKLEKKYLTRDVKIKPLTLFFIDNIEEYRSENGYLKLVLEKYVKFYVEKLLETETNSYYKDYLEQTLQNISLTHAGYFSKDNIEKDEIVEKEINEILHDKEAMLDLKNPRRFIFSKWTLREGWDNPNVFQICKLRSSGSDISKLQEVGRGLRLPVNEYGNRVKNEDFFLNYFVDFTESDFVEKLAKEINDKSGALSFEDNPEKLTLEITQQISKKYGLSEDELLKKLDENNVITRTNNYKEGGYDFIQKEFPLIFNSLNPNKIRKNENKKNKITVRTDKYNNLKNLWEKLNEKVILEYKFSQESQFQELFSNFLKEKSDSFSISSINEYTSKIEIENNKASSFKEISIFDDNLSAISTLKYSDFLLKLAKEINVNMKTIHSAFMNSDININNYLNNATIRIIKQDFNNYLMFNAINKFSIEYKKITNSIHPTKLTDKNGNPLKEIPASNVGILSSDCGVANNYYFNEMFYDSELEEKNIETEIKEVVVFTKIPKNSIKIPVAGGKTYSPDFAYVLKYKNGEQKLHFIIETKNVDGEEILREEEKQKIKHAEIFFNNTVKVEFKNQFNSDKIANLITEITQKNN